MTQTIHLQSIGSVPAVPFSSVEVGDVLMWSFGITSEVVAISPKGKQSVSLTTRNLSERHGSTTETYTATRRSSSLVARVNGRCASCHAVTLYRDAFCPMCGVALVKED